MGVIFVHFYSDGRTAVVWSYVTDVFVKVSRPQERWGLRMALSSLMGFMQTILLVPAWTIGIPRWSYWTAHLTVLIILRFEVWLARAARIRAQGRRLLLRVRSVGLTGAVLLRRDRLQGFNPFLN